MRIKHRRLWSLYADTRGATTVEYGLILAMIVTLMLAGASLLGGASGSVWSGLYIKVSNAMH